MRFSFGALASAAAIQLGLLGCGKTESGDMELGVGETEKPGTTGSETKEPGATSSEPGCQAPPLALGPVSDIEIVPTSIAWLGDTFAVGWRSPEGYQVRLTDGSIITQALVLPELSAVAAPQLLWTGEALELYYEFEDAVFVDTLDRQGALRVADSRLVGTGPGFRAVVTEPGSVAVLARSALFMDGEQRDATIHFVGAAGYDGEYFLYSSVLGHGEWTLYGVHRDGTPNLEAMELEWSGISGTGRAGGSSFASSASVGRHAVAIAADGWLTFAIEGMPSFERDMLFQEADVSALWDGERYLVLLANGPADRTTPATANRDIQLLTFSQDGQWLSPTEASWTLSDHPLDERFPVGASASPGDYAIAWAQGDTLVIQRCTLGTD